MNYKLKVKLLDGKIEMQLKEANLPIEEQDLIKEYEIITEDGNIRCTCEHGSLFPRAYIEGSKICSHIELFTKLPGLFEEQ